MERLGLSRRRPGGRPRDHAGPLPLPPRETAWDWPAAVPFTVRRALPDVLRIVLLAWRVPLAAAAAAALAGLLPPTAPATLLACAALAAIEETAHLRAAAHAAPAARLALVMRRPLRAAARIRPPLPPADAAAAAVAGPLAAGLAGLLVVSWPTLVAWRLLGDGGRGYLALTPALVPPLWLALAALPLPGSDAAIARAARRRAGLSRGAVLARAIRRLTAAGEQPDAPSRPPRD